MAHHPSSLTGLTLTTGAMLLPRFFHFKRANQRSIFIRNSIDFFSLGPHHFHLFVQLIFEAKKKKRIDGFDPLCENEKKVCSGS